MGFTFSHPALILPFKYLPRQYYSLSGLVMGSMAPDFEYFLRWDNQSSLSHTFKGIFLFDLPFAIIALVFFHEVMRNILIENSPRFIKTRLLFLLQLNWLAYFKQNSFVTLYSILIGACTHLFWDNFTALNGYFVQHNAFLATQNNIFGIEIFNYKILKHASSVIGGSILLYLFFKLPVAAVYGKQNKYYWVVIVVFFLCCTLLYLLNQNHEISYNRLAKKIISYFLFAVIVTSIFYKIYALKKNS